MTDGPCRRKPPAIGSYVSTPACLGDPGRATVAYGRGSTAAASSAAEGSLQAGAGSARVTLRARGRVVQSSLSCQLETGKPGLAAGLHPATGGDGSWACSGDLLLEALVSCAG